MAIDIARAWKDRAYRGRLSAADRAGLPSNPAGESILDLKLLGGVSGGALPTNGGAVMNTCSGTCTCHHCGFDLGLDAVINPAARG